MTIQKKARSLPKVQIVYQHYTRTAEPFAKWMCCTYFW